MSVKLNYLSSQFYHKTSIFSYQIINKQHTKEYPSQEAVDFGKSNVSVSSKASKEHNIKIMQGNIT